MRALWSIVSVKAVVNQMWDFFSFSFGRCGFKSCKHTYQETAEQEAASDSQGH